jgi:hypothetical protein
MQPFARVRRAREFEKMLQQPREIGLHLAEIALAQVLDLLGNKLDIDAIAKTVARESP